MEFVDVEDFDSWRTQARSLLASEVEPSEVRWSTPGRQPQLFSTATSGAERASPPPQDTAPAAPFRIPRQYLSSAREIACHRESVRWELLYRILWRLTHGEPHLLELSTDEDVFRFFAMQKAVARDIHKMHAFVRFRKVDHGGEARYVAWHRPDHRIVKLAAPFFARRFKGMQWSILTPDASASWDGKELAFGPGCSADEAPKEDALEDLWRAYYAATFNPARVKTAMMKREMPVRHWATLPETVIIPDLLREADSRVDRMVDSTEGFRETAARFLPADGGLPSLKAAAAGCTACDLCRDATQTVFGEGPAKARLVLIGEQPGDAEDLRGRPFVGPAGELLNDALQRAGIARDEVYVTNVVKHFKYTERGKRRLHQKPGYREVFACRPWVEAELAAIRPRAMVCLGATAAQALIGRDYRITQQRGEPVVSDWCRHTVATWHPASILRLPPGTRRQQQMEQLVTDLAGAGRVAGNANVAPE